MTSQPPPMMAKTAWEHSPTARYWKLQQWRCWIIVAIAAPIFVWAIYQTLVVKDARWFLPAVAGLVFFVHSLGRAGRGLKSRHVLMRYPWREYACDYDLLTPGESSVVIHDPLGARVAVMQNSPYVASPKRVNRKATTIWFAGDLRYGGAISPVGGGRPHRVLPSRGKNAQDIRPSDPYDFLADRLAREAGLLKD